MESDPIDYCAIGAGVGALAGYNNPKDGGKVAQASSANRPIMVAANEYTSNTFLGVTSDVAGLSGGWASGAWEKYNAGKAEQLETGVVEVIGRRLTPAQWAIEDAKTLAAETADRLMQMNFNRMADNFRDSAADRVNRATGSNVAGFITYTAVDTVKNTLNAPRYAIEALRYGYNLGGQIGSAMYNDPLNTGIGIGKSVLNFGPEAFNGAANLAKTSLNGISYLADPFSNIGQDFRATDAYNLTTQRYNGDAQMGGAIGVGVLSAVGPAAVSKFGAKIGNLGSVATTTGVNPQAVLQGVVNRAVADLNANPSLARDLMSPGSYRQLTNETGLASASYGKAIERLSARYVKEDSALSSVLSYQSRPFVSTPDFLGYNGYDLHLLDITTEASIPRHMLRSYGPATEYVTYPSMPKNLVFTQ